MQKTCIIVPCYNEASRLDIKVFCDFLQTNEAIDILFSNDGSTDDTALIIENIQQKFPNKVLVHHLKNNSGKAEAVRCGILEAGSKGKYEVLGFWDADLATPLTEAAYFLSQMQAAKKKIAIGSRMKRLGATVERKRSRHLLGRVFSTFSSIILKLPVYDTQCGAKLFNSELTELFEEKFHTKWLFDIELIARFRNKNGIKAALEEIVEVPINTWVEKGGSKLKFGHMLKVPFELLKINSIYNK